jgi:two-component system response regulator GlrR
VDDERLIADTLARILAGAGYETTTAYDGKAALAQVELFHPSLVISDVAMPELDGIRAAIQIRASHPECHVLLISGQASTLDLIESARKQGYTFEVLLKPVHPAELLQRIGDLLPRSRA